MKQIAQTIKRVRNHSSEVELLFERWTQKHSDTRDRLMSPSYSVHLLDQQRDELLRLSRFQAGNKVRSVTVQWLGDTLSNVLGKDADLMKERKLMCKSCGNHPRMENHRTCEQCTDDMARRRTERKGR